MGLPLMQISLGVTTVGHFDFLVNWYPYVGLILGYEPYVKSHDKVCFGSTDRVT